MPVLKDFRLTKIISVKEYPEAEIEVFNSVLARDGDNLIELEEKKNISQLVKVLTKFIKSWNFTDEAGKPLPVDINSLNLFSLETITEMVEKIKDFSENEKKK